MNGHSMLQASANPATCVEGQAGINTREALPFFRYGLHLTVLRAAVHARAHACSGEFNLLTPKFSFPCRILPTLGHNAGAPWSRGQTPLPCVTGRPAYLLLRCSLSLVS